MIDRLGLVVACGVTGVLLFFVLQSQHDARIEQDAIRARVAQVEQDLTRADETGGHALREHMATAIRRAHPESDSISCPVCPPCS